MTSFPRWTAAKVTQAAQAARVRWDWLRIGLCVLGLCAAGLVTACSAQTVPDNPAINPAAINPAASPTTQPGQSSNPSAVEISQTQLPPYAATIVQVDGKGLTIKLGNEQRVVPFEQLLRSRFPGSDPRVSPNDLSVELIDSSIVRCKTIQSDGKQLQLATAHNSLQIPTRQVTSCQIRTLDATLTKQWESLVESRITSDILILQRTPESLDKIEGIIGQVSESAVKFQFDGQDIDVQRTKLAGWRYVASAQNKNGKLLAVVRDRSASNWMVQSLAGNWSKPDNEIELTLVCGAVIKLPIASISEIDFSYGSMRFLADIEPLERKVQPRMALATQLPLAEKLFGPQPAAAQSARGATAGPGIDFLGSGSVVYRIPADFRRLQGTVALAPDGPQYVACKAQVMLEDKLLWEKTLSTPHEPFPIDLVVEPGKRLRLIVQSESTQPVGDLVSWQQLRFVK